MRIVLTVAVAAALSLGAAQARDLGQWSDDAAISHWFKNLKQPDNPEYSCCGEADAYFADSFEAEGDHYVAIITDDRDDAPLRRRHVDIGTRIVVPNNKIKWDAGNPTGHGVIFLLQGDEYDPGMVVLCFVAPGGV